MAKLRGKAWDVASVERDGGKAGPLNRGQPAQIDAGLMKSTSMRNVKYASMNSLKRSPTPSR